jgi:chromate transporter
MSNLKSFEQESYLRLFLRFLRFGFLAWGGPIAQLALMRKELVEEEKWITSDHFNRLIAIYQAIPGPEAHEIGVYFGTLARGKWGGLLAGLGFMLPGFVLMLILSWLYTVFGITTIFARILFGIKPAVIAWVVRGGQQLGKSILINYSLWLLAIAAFIAELYDVHFLLIFLSAALFYTIVVNYKENAPRNSRKLFKNSSSGIFFIAILIIIVCLLLMYTVLGTTSAIAQGTRQQEPSLFYLFLMGLKDGGLSFGSVYTVLSFIKDDAIIAGKWMTQKQLIDGLALSGSLPAPFIIITTFVGYLARGITGALLVTLGTFLPAFLIPIFGHTYLEKIALNTYMRAALDGITAAVAGLIAADILNFLKEILINGPSIGIFIVSLIALYSYRSHYVIVWIVLGGGIVGLILGP